MSIKVKVLRVILWILFLTGGLIAAGISPIFSIPVFGIALVVRFVVESIEAKESAQQAEASHA